MPLPRGKGATLSRWVLGLCLAGASGWSAAQTVLVPVERTVPATTAESPPPSGGAPADGVGPEQVVAWFSQGCIAHQGDVTAVVDWALAAGFELLDPTQAAGHSLLEGQPGTVLAAPGSSGAVILVSSQERCAVWAERQEGPPLRRAMAAEMARLGSRGAKVQTQFERNMESSGVWRSVVQWRYRAVGGYADLGIGAATRLGNAAGTQLLQLKPLGRVERYAPDGMPQ